MTEPELRARVLESFRELRQPDTDIVLSAAKGILEQRVLSDATDVQPALAALDALLAYFRMKPT